MSDGIITWSNIYFIFWGVVETRLPLYLFHNTTDIHTMLFGGGCNNRSNIIPILTNFTPGALTRIMKIM